MSIKMHKAIAVLLMLLALGWVVGAILATTRSAEIQGPSALAVLPDQTVWLSVDKALWHLNADGNRVARVEGETLGVGGRIGDLVLHPNGQLVAHVRGDATLYFLDAKTAAIQSRLKPQWQTDLLSHGSDAINYAFHSDGRVAIATGGGHAVALFDAQGHYLARTAPNLYRFTNGLWWVKNSLWTTDTNRQFLVELDGNTLAEISRISLNRDCGGFQYLGIVASSHGKPSTLTKNTPLITLVRFANGMIKGRASDIFPDGSQLDYPVSAGIEPRDIRWRGNELLMVDGASYSIKRYSDDRQHMANFGDMKVQAELTASLYRRNRLENQHKRYLGGAIMFFLLGFGFVWRARRLEKRQVLAALKIDLSQLGTPLLSPRARLAGILKLLWPTLLVVCASIFLLLYLLGHTPSLEILIYILLALLLVLPPAVFLTRRNVKRFASLPETEAIFNQHAVLALQINTSFWRSCQPDELPQETLALWVNNGLHWIVLTNQRLLLYVANLRDRRLARDYPLREVLRVHLLETHEMNRRQKLQKLFNAFGAFVRFEFRDGASLTGFTISAQTAQHIAAKLQITTLDTASSAPITAPATTPIEPHAPAAPNNKARWQTISSLLIPGLGQWMQRRSGTALVFFVVWLLILWNAVVIAVTLWNALSDVPWISIINAAIYYLLVCGLSGWEAWRMRERNLKQEIM
jgi:hypothetical protein